MVFTATVLKKMRYGRERVHFGKFVNTAASTGGDVDTGMRLCEFMVVWTRSADADASVDEDFTDPIPGNAVTVACGITVDGYFLAFGR